MSNNEDSPEVPEPSIADHKDCLRCGVTLTVSEMKVAAEDQLDYCVLCREAVATLRTAVHKAYGGRFKTGI